MRSGKKEEAERLLVEMEEMKHPINDGLRARVASGQAGRPPQQGGGGGGGGGGRGGGGGGYGNRPNWR